MLPSKARWILEFSETQLAPCIDRIIPSFLRCRLLFNTVVIVQSLRCYRHPHHFCRPWKVLHQRIFQHNLCILNRTSSHRYQVSRDYFFLVHLVWKAVREWGGGGSPGAQKVPTSYTLSPSSWLPVRQPFGFKICPVLSPSRCNLRSAGDGILLHFPSQKSYQINSQWLYLSSLNVFTALLCPSFQSNRAVAVRLHRRKELSWPRPNAGSGCTVPIYVCDHRVRCRSNH